MYLTSKGRRADREAAHGAIAVTNPSTSQASDVASNDRDNIFHLDVGDGKTLRVQLLMPEKSVRRLENIKVATGASSLAEVVRRAVQIYAGVLEEAGVGGEVVFRRPSGEELAVPAHLIAR